MASESGDAGIGPLTTRISQEPSPLALPATLLRGAMGEEPVADVTHSDPHRTAPTSRLRACLPGQECEPVPAMLTSFVGRDHEVGLTGTLLRRPFGRWMALLPSARRPRAAETG